MRNIEPSTELCDDHVMLVWSFPVVVITFIFHVVQLNVS